MIVVFVHGVDEANQKFRRQEVVICNGNTKFIVTYVTQNIAGRSPATLMPPTGTPMTQATQQTQSTQTIQTQAPQTTQVTQSSQTPQTSATTQTPVPGQSTTTTPSIPMTTSRGFTNLQFDVVFLIDGSQTAQPSFDSVSL